MLASPTADLRLRRRPLRLKRRRNDDNDLSLSSSLFARLSRSAVNRLYTDALCRGQQYEGSEDDGKEEGGWNVFSQQDRAAAVEFLPLSIKFSATSTIYVSYNGGEAADSSKGT